MDPKRLRDVQDAGWDIVSVQEDSCFVACPSGGCGMKGKILNGAAIPQRVRPGYSSEIRLEQYSDLVDELIDRRKSLVLSVAEVEEVAGLAFGHLAKLESQSEGRKVTMETLIIWANSLGYRVALVPDRLPPRALRMIAETRPTAERRARHPRFRTEDQRRAQKA